MITEETATAIARAHQEIRAAEGLIAELEKALGERRPIDFRDAFGRPRGLQLGIPSGDTAHRCFDVAPALALPVLRAHVAQQIALVEALTIEAVGEAARKNAPFGDDFARAT